jgi:hypothetical protein
MHDPTELRKEVGLCLRAAKNTSDPQLKRQMVVRALGLWEQVDALSRAADDGPLETTLLKVTQAASYTLALPVPPGRYGEGPSTEENGPRLLGPRVRGTSKRLKKWRPNMSGRQRLCTFPAISLFRRRSSKPETG